MTPIDGLALAREFGTPLHVIDREALLQNARTLKQAFERGYAPTEVYVSFKTNPVPQVLGLLYAEGIGAEVVSAFELWLAGELGIPTARTVVNGPGKRPEFIDRCAATGVRLFNVDSLGEVDRVGEAAARHGRELRLGCRVRPTRGWKNQFGLEPAQVLVAASRIRQHPLLRFEALQVQVGSNLADARSYVEAIRDLAALASQLRREAGVTLSTLDLGGGFGVPSVERMTRWEAAYSFLIPGETPHFLRTPPVQPIDAVAGIIGEALRKEFSAHSLPLPTLVVEPGRALLGEAQTLLIEVLDVKTFEGSTYAITTCGPSTGARPLLGERHPISLLGEPRARRRRYTLAGPLCTPADVFAEGVELPELKVGDVLAIAGAGAYFLSYESAWAFPRSAVVMVDAQGEARLIRRPESFEEMVARDLPGRSKP
ncbi:hypothetical protein G4177_26675 [Corallococcus sp. ZKHCc1 1396]|uniref:Orn/DAP/Arg decarboxylase 2 N-terminal domain-containing protein n=1 Tax=Corallococcus soli TaxID=2710757 RepID=A0ABR9PV10_9BACT|nr:hypothetical protein [Corallococcus soli]MBE4751760.1 hypothetical protein [Corallococcus soli]